MELSFEVKQKIDTFITQCENWLINEIEPPYLKLDAKFGAVKEYLSSKDFYGGETYFETFIKVNSEALFEDFKKDNPTFDEKSSDCELWDKWYELIDENQISTICKKYHKTNDKFDYDLCDEEDYYIPEYIVIHLDLDYDEGNIYLNIGNGYDY
jgi:hypothetical protein